MDINDDLEAEIEDGRLVWKQKMLQCVCCKTNLASIGEFCKDCAEFHKKREPVPIPYPIPITHPWLQPKRFRQESRE